MPFRSRHLALRLRIQLSDPATTALALKCEVMQVVMAIEVYSALGIEATTSLSWSLGQGIAGVTDTSIPRIPHKMPEGRAHEQGPLPNAPGRPS